MNRANIDAAVFREKKCVDPKGRRIRQACGYDFLGIIKCARISSPRRNVASQDRENNKNKFVITYHNWNQASFIDIKKHDYFGISYDAEARFYRVKWITVKTRFKFRYCDGITYKLEMERLEPRECPKELVSKYLSDVLK